MKALKPSFTIIELIIVIIIIGILAYTINFNFFDNNLKLAADQIENHIRYTESLAFKDDKYRPFPVNDNNQTEKNRSKFWFMQWWQIRFSKKRNGDIYYVVFSDSPDYDRNPIPSETAKDPLTHQHLYGDYSHLTATNKLNLTQTYGIKEMRFDNISLTSGHPKRILFDNFGNVFLNEGSLIASDNNYTLYNRTTSGRPLLNHILHIDLCKDLNCNICIRLNLTPAGEVYQTNCN